MGQAAGIAILKAIAATVVATAVSYALNKVTANFDNVNAGRDDAAARNARLGNRVATAENRKMVYGRLLVGGPIIYDRVTAFGPHTAYRHLLVVWAGHEIDSIQEYRIDGEPVPLSALDSEGIVTTGKYKDFTRLRGYTGSPGQSVDTLLLQADSNINTSHKGTGIAYTYHRFTANEQFDSGIPQRFEAIIHGKKCYDPRLDSTAGGSGSHRQGDSTTWEFTTNPALFLLDYLTDSFLGKGTPYSKINIASFADAANRCDTLIQLTGGGTTQRYKGAAFISTGDTFGANVSRLLALFDGRVYEQGGELFCVSLGPETITDTIDETFLGGEIAVQTEEPLSSAANFISGTYWDELRAYQQVQFQPRTSTSYQTQDGGKLSRSIALNGVTSEARAQYLAEITLRRTRNTKQVILNCNFKALFLTPFSVVRINFPTINEVNTLYRIVDYRINDNSGGVTLYLQRYDATLWDWSPATDYIPPPGAITLTHEYLDTPNPTAAAGASVAGGVFITWTNPPADLFTHMDLLESDTDDPVTATKIYETRSNQIQLALAEGTSKYYWVQTVGTDGGKSDLTGIAGLNLTGGSATANGAAITVSDDPPSSPSEGDLWFESDAGNEPHRYNGTAWVSIRDTSIADAQATADSKNQIYRQATQPSGTHVAGDLWVDSDDGNHVYVWNGTAWEDSQDQDAIQALLDATAASNLAGEKARVYRQASTPVGAGSGDLWIDTDDGNHLYIFTGSSWVSARDTEIANALTEAQNAGTLADGKITSYWQPNQPSGLGLRDGDLWFDTDDGNKQYRYQNPVWSVVQDDAIADAIADAATAQATADGKVTTYVTTTGPVGASVGDLFFDSDDDFRLYRWNGFAWASVRDGRIQVAIDSATLAQSTADGKITSYYQSQPPTGGDLAEGDFWIDSDDQNKIYRYSGSTWVPSRDTGIDSAILASATAQTTADGAQSTADIKIVTYFQTSLPVGTHSVGDLWIDTDDDNRLYRWSGTGWQDARDLAVEPNVPSLIGCKPNFGSFGGFGAGRIYIHGFSDGAGADVDGKIAYLGNVVNVPRGAMVCRLPGQGVILFQTTGASAFSTSIGTKPYACCWLRGNQWYYDNGSGSTGATFNLSPTMVIIGTWSVGQFNSVSNAAAFSSVQSPLAIGANLGGRMPDQRTNVMLSNFNIGAIQSWSGGGALITASDAGSTSSISIKAHAVYWGTGLTTSYNAGTISGLSFETQYHLYCEDGDYSGGSVTYQATTNPATVAASNDRYYVGSVTTPADGGGTSNGNPGGGCVEKDSYLGPENTRASELKLGDPVTCHEGDELRLYSLKVKQAARSAVCVRLIAGGATLVCSVDTPVNLEDGTWLRASRIAGKKVAVLRNSAVTFETCQVEPVGMREVIPMSFGGKSFAASEAPTNNKIFTHNSVKNPDIEV